MHDAKLGRLGFTGCTGGGAPPPSGRESTKSPIVDEGGGFRFNKMPFKGGKLITGKLHSSTPNKAKLKQG